MVLHTSTLSTRTLKLSASHLCNFAPELNRYRRW